MCTMSEKLFPAASVDRGGVGSDRERGGGVWQTWRSGGNTATEAAGESCLQRELGELASIAALYNVLSQAPYVNIQVSSRLHLICLCPPSPSQLAEWWSQVAYLGWRLPVAVHVSPAIVFPQQPIQDTNSFLRLEHTRIDYYALHNLH